MSKTCPVCGVSLGPMAKKNQRYCGNGCKRAMEKARKQEKDKEENAAKKYAAYKTSMFKTNAILWAIKTRNPGMTYGQFTSKMTEAEEQEIYKSYKTHLQGGAA